MRSHLGGPTARLWLALFLCFAACGPQELDVNVDARYQSVRENLIKRHLVNGVVVSLGNGKRQPNNRDALLHTSLAMAALPCEDAPRLLSGIASLEIEPGRYVRYFDYPKSDQISRDMIIGLVFGMAQKYRTCSQVRPEVRRRMARLLRFIDEHADSLGTGPAAQLTPASRAAIQFAAKIMDLHPGPTLADRAVLAAQAGLLPISVLSAGVQFYAVHLTSLELILWTWAEGSSADLSSAQSLFCRVTEPYGNPLYDGACGRYESLKAALWNWEYNCEVYRWQVSNPWRKCNPNGVKHPGHDFLLLVQLFLREGLTGEFVPKLPAPEIAAAPLTPGEAALSLWTSPRWLESVW